MVFFTETVKIVTLQGLPSKELAFELVFDFPIETLSKNVIQSQLSFFTA
jgi:hypothetical protein